jgi:DNA-binding transcriptional ArsR family regulator
VSRRSSFEPKEFEVITDIGKIKLLLESSRREIVFRYLVAREMTVKQLADAMRKTPGNILHHVNKLKKAGIIKQVRTRETETGIVERYYRATAKDFRLGISEVLGPAGETSMAKEDRAKATILGLGTLNVSAAGKDVDQGRKILSKIYAIEEEIASIVDKRENIAFQSLPPSTRRDVTEAMTRFLLSKNGRYQELVQEWNDFMASHLNGGQTTVSRT